MPVIVGPRWSGWIAAAVLLAIGAPSVAASAPLRPSPPWRAAAKAPGTRPRLPVSVPVGDARRLAANSRRAVVLDFDHDGHLDLIVSMARCRLIVWRNDGHGHLVRQRPRRLAIPRTLRRTGVGRAWLVRAQFPIQNEDPPSFAVFDARRNDVSLSTFHGHGAAQPGTHLLLHARRSPRAPPQAA